MELFYYDVLSKKWRRRKSDKIFFLLNFLRKSVNRESYLKSEGRVAKKVRGVGEKSQFNTKCN